MRTTKVRKALFVAPMAQKILLVDDAYLKYKRLQDSVKHNTAIRYAEILRKGRAKLGTTRFANFLRCLFVTPGSRRVRSQPTWCIRSRQHNPLKRKNAGLMHNDYMLDVYSLNSSRGPSETVYLHYSNRLPMSRLIFRLKLS